MESYPSLITLLLCFDISIRAMVWWAQIKYEILCEFLMNRIQSNRYLGMRIFARILQNEKSEFS